jgi:hypothetical protein
MFLGKIVRLFLWTTPIVYWTYITLQFADLFFWKHIEQSIYLYAQEIVPIGAVAVLISAPIHLWNPELGAIADFPILVLVGGVQYIGFGLWLRWLMNRRNPR